MLRGAALYKQINGTTILNNVDISLEPGAITALIGPSGSGKSSLLSCLSLLTNPTKGIVSLEERKFEFNSGKENYSDFPYPDVTVVFQGLFLWPHLTNRENVLLPLHGKEKNVEEFNNLVERLGVKKVLDKFPNDCSGGEKQRIAFIRQVLLRPKYLLLDEITSALDLEQVKILSELLLDLKEKGTGILLVTHMINLAKNIADDVYFLDNGEMIEHGKTEILTTPKTERLNKFLQIYT